MKKTLPLLLAALLLAGCSVPSPAAAPTPAPAAYRQVAAEEAVALMESEEGYILLDVRTPEEYAQGHIPGAICISHDTIGAARPDELPDTSQLILVYCRSGNRSKQAAAKLAALGYANVVEFGGINAWPGEVVTGEE